MSNLISVSERVSIPSTATRADCKELARRMFGSVSSCAAAVSRTAARDTFVSQCVSLVISEMVNGDHSRLNAFEAYAATLPEYKLTKRDGKMIVSGRLGQLIAAYRQAVSIGGMVRNHADFDRSADSVDLQKWLVDSASFGALVALPEKAKTSDAPSAVTITTVQKPQKVESVASLQQKLAIERNWFNRDLHTCDSTGDFNSAHRGAVERHEAMVEEAKVRKMAEEAQQIEEAKAPKLFEDEYYTILRSNPDQAIAMLKRMAEFSGFKLTALPKAKRA